MFAKKIKKKYIIILLFVLFIVFVSVDVAIAKLHTPKLVPYTEFEEQVKAGKVDVVYYSSDTETMRYYLFNDETKDMSYDDRKEYVYDEEDAIGTYYPAYEDFRKECLEQGIRLIVKDFTPSSLKIIQLASALLIPIVIIYLAWTIYKTTVKFDKDTTGDMVTTSNVKFADVIGLDEVLKDVQFIVELMKNPNLGSDVGARVPKGILLSGEPGTGKTLIAKAIAGEAGVPFIYMNASSFVEMFVGLGAKRVRSLFEQARKHSPCIIFIDEIDAVGAKRTRSGTNSENDQTLNALLQEMDGFSTSEGIFIIGATNIPDKLDKALLRAGRFDREIVIPPPHDWKIRRQLFEHYLKGKSLADDVDIKALSKQTVGFTGADIEAIVNEAALITSMNKLSSLNMDSFENAIDKHIFKGNRTNNKDKEEDRRIVAYHEAGHAVVSYLQGIKIARASIVGTTTGVGGAVFRQEDDRILPTKTDFKKKIMVCYGGRASEEIKFNEITVGASNDIEQATHLMKDYFSRFGFDEGIGLVNIDELTDGPALSNDFIREKVSKLSNEIYQDTVKLLKDKYDLVERLAEKLLELESLSSDAIYEVLEGGTED